VVPSENYPKISKKKRKYQEAGRGQTNWVEAARDKIMKVKRVNSDAKKVARKRKKHEKRRS